MADCDLCGVGRPTLCPVKPDVPRFRNAYPTGMWMGICEECTNACHDANTIRSKAKGSKCNLCGRKGEQLYAVEMRVPDFSEPYYKEKVAEICESCLEAAENTYNKRQAELASHTGHH